MVIGVAVATGVVVIVNEAAALPAGMVTVSVAVESSLQATTTPPVGAATLNVTIPCEVSPPVTLVVLRASETSFGRTLIVTIAA